MTSFRRLLRHHRLIWWVFGVSLLLSWLGSLPARAAFGELLDHSKASASLVAGFDVGTWAELTTSPEFPMGALYSASFAAMAVFFVFLLFVAGGVYASFQSERVLSLGEFFQACGAHFWRMVRLTLVSLIPFGLLGGAYGLFAALTKGLAESPSERLPDYVLWASLAVLGLLMLLLRAWFDLAQARTVARGERGMFKTALRTFRLLSLRLYGAYLGIGLLRLGLTALLLWAWMRTAPNAIGAPFLIMELVVLVHVATRLWQRATAVAALERIEIG